MGNLLDYVGDLMTRNLCNKLIRANFVRYSYASKQARFKKINLDYKHMPLCLHLFDSYVSVLGKKRNEISCVHLVKT